MNRPVAIAILTATLGIAAMAVVVGTHAAAQSSSVPACNDTSGAMTPMIACAGSFDTAAEERLAKAYREVACYLSADQQKRLAEIQRAWSDVREADCDFWKTGGQVDRMNIYYCRAAWKNQRAQELENYPFVAPRSVLGPCQPR